MQGQNTHTYTRARTRTHTHTMHTPTCTHITHTHAQTMANNNPTEAMQGQNTHEHIRVYFWKKTPSFSSWKGSYLVLLVPLSAKSMSPATLHIFRFISERQKWEMCYNPTTCTRKHSLTSTLSVPLALLGNSRNISGTVSFCAAL